MKKLIALTAITAMTQAPASILMPVKIKKIETVEIETKAAAARPIVNSGGRIIKKVIKHPLTQLTADAAVKETTGRSIGERIIDGAREARRSMDTGHDSDISKPISGFLSGLFGN